MMLDILYLIAGLLFIVGIKLMTKVKTARHGNVVSACGMFLVVTSTLGAMHLHGAGIGWYLIGGAVVLGTIIGLVVSSTVKMTAMPELVALFNGFGGGASLAVAIAFVLANPVSSALTVVTVWLSIAVGSITLFGSIVAFCKLRGWLRVVRVHYVITALVVVAMIGESAWILLFATSIPAAWYGVVAIAGVLGILLTLPIGGANMPVVIALLNSLSGLAAASAGFVLSNFALVMSGALVGASGLILTQVMCKAMNRTLASVLFSPASNTTIEHGEYKHVKSCSSEEAALVLDSASSVIIIPGYGLAVAQAQHAVQELAEELQHKGKTVKFAIHPVAGRMPGHMNVLLAEADVPYDNLFDLDHINNEFKRTDVVLVVGANDVVNPAAATTTDSPIYGMPILNAHHARSVLVIKRSLSPGFAGVKNELFEADNASLVYGDAKEVLITLTREMQEL